MSGNCPLMSGNAGGVAGVADVVDGVVVAADVFFGWIRWPVGSSNPLRLN